MSQKLIAGPIKGYKFTDKDMKCRGIEFKLGEIVELGNTNDLETCQNGFHFCEQPSGVWSYYSEGRVFECEAYDVLDVPFEAGADFKRVCRKIKLTSEIKIGGDSNTGYSNTGYRNTGDSNTGDSNTGDSNTGDSNTGYSNTGYRNTGDSNTGYRNTGDRNTGDSNTGDRNTGMGCVGDNMTGYFCSIKQPTLIFDKATKENINYKLVHQLSCLLELDNPFDVKQFLPLPNATEKKIKELHKKHIIARQLIRRK